VTNCSRCSHCWPPAVLLIVLLVASAASAAPTIWTGPTISFAKASGADFNLTANQDQLTTNVALTRGNVQGMINILAESSFSGPSPTGTLWATSLNNPADTISAANWAALDFTTWTVAYGNSVGNNILNHNAVVHLIDDDVYLDLSFTAFQGMGGGGFAYVRSTPVPEPSLAALVAIAALLSATIRRRS
jgi:hypothetical protein